MLKLIFANKVATQCGTCRFWQADEDDDGVVVGECRIHSPEFSTLSSVPPEPDAQAALLRRPWPMTESRDWCAEWKT
jgi:hypothetical protein